MTFYINDDEVDIVDKDLGLEVFLCGVVRLVEKEEWSNWTDDDADDAEVYYGK